MTVAIVALGFMTIKEFVFLLAAAAFFAAIASVWLGIKWVLGPLDRAARNRRYPVQFSLADFLCLFVQVQLALGGPTMAFRGMDGKTMAPAITACTIILALVILVWWTGVRTLSRAGVHGVFSRAVTLTVGIPFGFVLSAAIPIVAILAFASLDPSSNMPRTAFFVLLELATVLVIVALGFMTRRILIAAEQQEGTPPGDAETPI